MMRRKIAACLATVLLFSVPVMPVHASGNDNWVKKDYNTFELKDEATDTDIIVKVKNGTTLEVMGKGSIPDFTADAFGKRPWNDRDITSLIIGKDIKSVGAYSFSALKRMHDVTMYAGTIIASPSAFDGYPQGTSFYIKGMEIYDLGVFPNISYTNIDKLTEFMAEKNFLYNFQVDNTYMASMIQSRANLAIQHLSTSDVYGHDNNPAYPLIDYSTSMTVLAGDTSMVKSSSILPKSQGRTALEIYSILLGDRTYATSYNIQFNTRYDAADEGIIRQVSTPYTIQMTVPNALLNPGRQFSVIELGAGIVKDLQDEDNSDATVTFSTDYLTGTYALVYKDM